MGLTIPQNVGIDISKANLDVALLPSKMQRRFTNDAKGHKALGQWLGSFHVELIVFEATGIYHRLLERYLRQQGFPYAKLNPRWAKRFSEAIGTTAKTDQVDANMLARLGATLEPKQSRCIPETVETLKDLVNARRALIKDQTAARNRLEKTTCCMLLKRQAKKRMKQIEADVAAIDIQCRKLVTADKSLKRRYAIIVSVPGLGDVTAMTILAEMPELGSMNKKQVASLTGLAPVTRQSGTWQGKSFIRGGRANLRRALYMPALVAIQHNKQFKVAYAMLIEKGKPKKVAIVAAMRQLIILVNALVQQNRLWEAAAPK